MSFYDDASLVLIPSGYKAGKLYSAKPTDGSGDLSFTRTGSTATRVNSAGLIEECRTNQAIYSNQINDASWARANVTVSADTIANPIDGLVNADTIVLSAGTTQKYIGISNALNGFYTYSFYLKYISHQFIQVFSGIDAGFYCNFDLQNKTLSASSCTGAISDIGNGWIRCSLTFTSTTGSGLYFLAVDSLSSLRFTATSSTGSFYAFGAQLEIGDIATAYIATTSAAVTVGPIANVPRLDYTGGGCPKLLMEPTRTNLFTYSEAFNNAAWTKSSMSVTSNSTTSPDGTTNADTITVTFTASEIYAGSSSTMATATATVFVKKGNQKYFGISINGTNNFDSRYQAVFNLDNGTLFQENNSSTPLTNKSVKIESYGNGWYRCAITATFATTTTAFVVFQHSNAIPTIPSNSLAWNNSTNGNTYIWGAQVEAGSYATSYIPTWNASVTRNEDVFIKTGISSLIGQTEGTLLLDFIYGHGSIGAVEAFSLSDGTISNRVIIRKSGTTGTIQAVIFSSGATIGPISKFDAVVGQRYKCAIAYKLNDFVFYINGQLVGFITSGAVPSALNQIANNAAAASTSLFEPYNQVQVYKTRLSNDNLAILTTL